LRVGRPRSGASDRPGVRGGIRGDVEQRRDRVADEVESARTLIEDRIDVIELETETLRRHLVAAGAPGEIPCFRSDFNRSCPS
jgi:hypothetical protein